MPRPFEGTLLVVFVPLRSVPTGATVPVGCVRTGAAEATEETMAKAAIAKETTVSLRIEMLPFPNPLGRKIRGGQWPPLVLFT